MSTAYRAAQKFSYCDTPDSLVVMDCEKFVGIITENTIHVTAPIAPATVSRPAIRVPEAARNRF